MRKQTKALLAIILTAILGGGIPVMSKVSLIEIPPLSVAALRFSIASVFLLPTFIKYSPRKLHELSKVIGASLFGTVNILLFVFGIKYTSATMGQMIYALVPVLAGILSYFLIKEKITGKKILGVGLGLLGTIIIVLLPVIEKGVSLESGLKGNLLILMAVMAFSFYPVLSKKLQKKYNPLFLSSVFIITTAIVALALSLSDWLINPYWWQSVSLQAWIGVIYLGIFGGAGYYVLYQYAIKYGTPIIASMILYLQPAMVFLWAKTLLGEKLTPGLVVGGILALTGAYLTTASNKKARD